uniref:Uncharacterized protein n=1 Tax=Medicago truncatula TaxID=3880 RepID=I3SD43_MEDTR|nr:unknown [Medicago truncatula]
MEASSETWTYQQCSRLEADPSYENQNSCYGCLPSQRHVLLEQPLEPTRKQEALKQIPHLQQHHSPEVSHHELQQHHQL